MAKVRFFAIIFMVTMVMTRVSAEEPPVKVTVINEVTLGAEAAASSFKSSAGEAAEGARSWADWATSKIRHPGGWAEAPAPASE